MGASGFGLSELSLILILVPGVILVYAVARLLIAVARYLDRH